MQNTPPAEHSPGSDTPRYAREFPGFELDFKLPEGFEDTSWHNNETPSFDKAQPDGTILKLLVDYVDRSKSTLPEEEPYFRFSLARYTPRTRIGLPTRVRQHALRGAGNGREV